MSLGPYQGHLLVPGMQPELYSVESDLTAIVYGPLHHCVFLTHAVIDGASRDAGNTGHTEVLRPGLIMQRDATSKKWSPWTNAGVAEGILVYPGINTQYGNADADRSIATIIVKGSVKSKGCAIAANTAYGIPTTGDGLTVRQQLLYNFMWDDDFTARLSRTPPI